MADPATVDERRKRNVQGSEWDHHATVVASTRSPSSPNEDSQRNLAVPFKGHVEGGMRTGKKLIVVGVVNSRPDRFYIGLTRGHGTSQEPPTDVALELAVRFKERQVFRRACVSGTWGETETAIPYFPFIRDQPFRIEISCEQSHFRIFVDGQKLFDFRHRVLALEDINTLWITGSVRITKLG